MYGKLFLKNCIFSGEQLCHKCDEEIIHQRFPTFGEKNLLDFAPKSFEE